MLALPQKLKINNKVYIIGEQIEQVNDRTVFRGYEESDPKTQLAIKVCSNMRNDELKFLQKHVLKKELSNLIRYHEISVATQEQPLFIFVMELAEGNLFENIIQKPINLELKEVLEISLQIAKGIQSIHNLGFMHRDLKPENIVKVGNQWKICDFGLSRHKLSSQLTQKIGTAYYIAPEMLGNIAGEDQEIEYYNQQVDIWALGCIIYEIQTKNLFFDGNNFDTVTYKIKQFAQVNLQKFPPQDYKFQQFPHKPLCEILKKMLIVIPELRITIDKVIEEIQKLIKQIEEQQKGNNDAFKTYKPIVNVMQTGGQPIVPKQPIEFNKPFPQFNKPLIVEQKQGIQPLINQSGQPPTQFQFQQQNPQTQKSQQNTQKLLKNQSFPLQTTNAFATFIPQPQNPQNQQNLQPQNQVAQIHFQGQIAQNNFPAQAPKFNQNQQHPFNAQQPINPLNQQNSSQITSQPQNISTFGQIPQESKPFVAAEQLGIPPPQPQPQINGNYSQLGHSANQEINVFDCQNTQNIKPLQIQKSAQTVKITLKPLLPEQIYIEISTPQQIIQKYLVQNFIGSGMELLLNIEGNQ